MKRWSREYDLWTSSCMVAREGEELLGVLLSAKRDDVSLIQSIGVKPGHERRGHAGHMLTSLAQKLAILGPPRMLAEIPADCAVGRSLFEARGYREIGRTRDWILPATQDTPAEPAPEFFVDLPLTELIAAVESVANPAVGCWARNGETLRNQTAKLQAVAAVSDVRVEAWIVFDPEAPSTLRRFSPNLGPDVAEPTGALLAIGAIDRAAARWWPHLLRQVGARSASALELPRVGRDEFAETDLTALGFLSGTETVIYETVAEER